jgi:hypothetical protein
MFVNSTGTPIGNNLNVSGSVTLSMVPEPSTWALLALGSFVGVLLARRHKGLK